MRLRMVPPAGMLVVLIAIPARGQGPARPSPAPRGGPAAAGPAAPQPAWPQAGMAEPGAMPEDQAAAEPESCFQRGDPGCWRCISQCASPSNTCGYIGYFVGGGCQHGEPRHPLEGVWGWDFCGHCLNHHPVLLWCHDPCKKQGGRGDYRTGLHESE